MDAEETLGQRIRKLRHERGMTLQQVAGADFSRAFLHQVETGRSQPSTRVLRMIADRLGGRAANVHFEDRFDNGEFTFDYRMRPGVVRHTNGLALMRAVGIEFEELDAAEIRRRWPVFDPPPGTRGLFQSRGAIVPAARGTSAMQRLATAYGAALLGSTAVTGVEDHGSHLAVETVGPSYTCRGVVVCADAWTNQVLARLGVSLHTHAVRLVRGDDVEGDHSPCDVVGPFVGKEIADEMAAAAGTRRG